MNIGDAAKASGVSARMIRHYENVGLLPPAGRSQAGYRLYGDRDVQTLLFIRRSRDLGFSLEKIHSLVSLWQDRTRSSSAVKRLAQQHLNDLDRKLEELQSMKNALSHLVGCCQGDERPDCPILENLAGLEKP